MSKRISFLIFMLSMLMQPYLFAQKGGIEQYNYLGTPGEAVFVPMLHFENKKGWYAEARYNYEEAKTFSLYLGKSFSHEGVLSWTLTPMAGIAAGNLKGGSLGFNVDMDKGKFYLSAQSQFTAATDKAHLNFFYNWSEIGYTISERFYTGLSVQQAISGGESLTEKGILAGISFNKISIPVYFFKPFSPNRYLIIGINWEWGKS